MSKPAAKALADFLKEYRRDNVKSVSCANLFDAAAAMLVSSNTELEKLRGTLEDIEHDLKTCDWSCERCGKENDMTETDIHLYVTDALKVSDRQGQES